MHAHIFVQGARAQDPHGTVPEMSLPPRVTLPERVTAP